MKKIIGIIAGILLLILVALIALPMIFRDDIIAWIKTDVNKNFTATVDFADVDLSLIRSFPQMSVGLRGLTVVNHEPFAGDTLAVIDNLEIALQLSSLWQGGAMVINSILVERPRISVMVNSDGAMNTNIVKPNPEQMTADDESAGGASFELRDYRIVDADIEYADESGGVLLKLDGFNHRGSGDFTASQFAMTTETNIANIRFDNGGATLINNAKLDATVNVAVDLATNKYTLQQNTIVLNALQLNASGWVQQVGENLEMDIKFDAPEAQFKDLLSMIPFIYRKDFADLQADGSFLLRGSANGSLTETQIPAFEIALDVKNGMFQYPDLPTPVENVQIQLLAKNPGKTADATVIDLQKMHIEILKEPLDAKLLVKTPVSDPYLETNIVGRLNLGEVKNIFPLGEGVELAGKVQSDFQLKGALSAIQNNDISKFSTGGTLKFSEVKYAAPELPEAIALQSADLQFSPQRASLQNLRATFGNSDLQANGVLENIFGYVFHDQTVKGTLALQSKLLDLNPWIAGESEPLQAIELPAKVEFLLAADCQKVLFDKLEMKNVKGNLLLKDQKLSLLDLNANMLQGSLRTSGEYSYIPPKKPEMFFDVLIDNFAIPETFTSFVTVQKFMPLSEKMDGKFSGQLTLNSSLDQNLLPVMSALTSKGSLVVPKVKITDTDIFNKLSEKLSLSALHNPALSDVNPTYSIKNGRFYVEPFKFNIDKYLIEATGSNGIDQSVDYAMKVHVPAAELRDQANAAISQFIKTDANMLSSGTVVVDVKVGGTFKNPVLNVSGANVLEGATDPLKAAADAEAAKQKAEAERKMKEELEKKKKEAEQKLKDKLKGIWKKD